MTRTIEPAQYPTYKDEAKLETLNPRQIEPGEIQPRDQFGYKIIAIVDHRGMQWAAYKGLTSWDDGYVRDHGDKLRQEIAELLFPVLAAKLPYRA